MDICDLILDDHAEQRKLFALIEQIARNDTEALESVWTRLGALLDTHAEAEEQLFYPAVLRHGHGAGGMSGPSNEVQDAIKDHNEIRDAASAVRRLQVGTDAWFAAIDLANKVNSEHMSEEEREGLTDMRRNTSVECRHELGVRFAAFDATYVAGVPPIDKDPTAYIQQNS